MISLHCHLWPETLRGLLIHQQDLSTIEKIINTKFPTVLTIKTNAKQAGCH